MEHVIISKIIEIETKAQNLIKEAKEEQNKIPQKVSEVLEQKKKEYMDKADKHIKYIKSEEAKFADERIAAMKKDHDEKLDKLKKLTDSHISDLVDKIYEYIIKPTDLTI